MAMRLRRNIIQNSEEAGINQLNNIPNNVAETEREITGQNMLYHIFSSYVLHTQIETLLITCIVIGLIFIGYFGFKLGCIGMITNIIPLLLCLGSISFLGIPFDFATVLVASIALGLSVDDSIHLLHTYHEQRKRNAPTPLIASFKAVISPITMTSILLSVGFGVFISSELVILSKFGIFSCVAILAALFANLVVLPLLISRYID